MSGGTVPTSSLAALKAAIAARTDAKDDHSTATTQPSSDSDIRALLVAIDKKVGDVRDRVSKLEQERVSSAVSAPVMSAPLPSAASLEHKAQPGGVLTPLRGTSLDTDLARVRAAAVQRGLLQGGAQRELVVQTQQSQGTVNDGHFSTMQMANAQEPNIKVLGTQPHQPGGLLPDTGVLFAVRQADALGGFHTFYLTNMMRDMKDIAIKSEVEFLCRNLDELLSDFECPPLHPHFRRVLSRVVALQGFDRTRNPAYLKLLSPAEDKLIDPESQRTVDEAVVKYTRNERQLRADGGGNNRRRRRGAGWTSGARGGWRATATRRWWWWRPWRRS